MAEGAPRTMQMVDAVAPARRKEVQQLGIALLEGYSEYICSRCTPYFEEPLNIAQLLLPCSRTPSQAFSPHLNPATPDSPAVPTGSVPSQCSVTAWCPPCVVGCVCSTPESLVRW